MILDHTKSILEQLLDSYSKNVFVLSGGNWTPLHTNKFDGVFFLRTFFPAGVRSVGTGRQRRIGVVLYLFRGNQRGGALLINHRWTIFVFSNFLGLIWRGTHQVLQKKCTRVLLQNVVRMTKVIQKLGHHASTLCCVGGGNSWAWFL